MSYHEMPKFEKYVPPYQATESFENVSPVSPVQYIAGE